MDKRKITLTVIGVAILLVVLVGSTYAYWTLGTNTGASRQATVQTGGLILRLDDVNGITSNDVIDPNNLSFSKYFSITNESNADGYAKILFKGLTNTFVTDALVYDLEEVQSDKTSFATPRVVLSETVLPKSASASNQTLADGLLIEKGTVSGNTVTPNTKYYKLTVRYKYSDTVDQSEDLRKTLTSGFTMEEGQSSVTMNVSFITNDTNITNPTNRTVTYGNNYDLPVLTKEGYRLEGWYLDSELTNRVENGSKVLQNSNHTLYAKWKESKFECLDESGNEMICPKTLAIGQRVAIRDTSNVQVFRYIRTTSTSSNLSECGTTSSVACADSTNGVHRFLAEYNLKITGTASSSTAIAADALQDPSDSSNTNAVQYGASNSDYNQSYVKTYLNNYATTLSTMIGEANLVTVNALSKAEAESLFGCPSGGGRCTTIPDWAHNSHYWLGSANNNTNAWYVDNYGYLGYNSYNFNNFGARAVVNISASLI